MTLAKKTFYLSSAVLLAGAMAVAQTAMGGSSQDQESSMAGQAAGARVRGCLSGSAGNYTLTDNNGTIYHLVGSESQLQSSVGHEVEITGTPDAQRSGASDDMASNTASSFQVTGAREIAARCDHASTSGTMGTESQPMTERPPTTDRQPKGAPGEGAPPPQPQPHMIAMLQQPGSTDTGNMGSQAGSTTATSPSTSASQTPGNGSMANTPVTSQTPAEPASPIGANSQLGSGTTNPSAVSEQPAQTGTPNTPQAGETGTTGSNPASGMNNANTGVNANSGTNTNPEMNTNSGTTTNPGTTTSPQSTQNDPNKPLYERQATDIPWASHSGSTTTTTTTNPNGSSSTTTTTTTPQPEPHL
jgi:hypothetical protein